MATLSKDVMTSKISAKLGLNKVKAKQFVEYLFAEIANSLVSGREVKLFGFGNFNLRDKGTRPGRNPKTGEEVAIKPRRVVTFRAGQSLKELVTTKMKAVNAEES